MKLKIPKSFRMANAVIKVTKDKKIGQRCRGENSVTGHWIKIDAKETEQAQKETFIHELVEHAARQLSLDIWRRNEEMMFLATHRELDMLARLILEAFETMEY